MYTFLCPCTARVRGGGVCRGSGCMDEWMGITYLVQLHGHGKDEWQGGLVDPLVWGIGVFIEGCCMGLLI